MGSRSGCQTTAGIREIDQAQVHTIIMRTPFLGNVEACDIRAPKPFATAITVTAQGDVIVAGTKQKSRYLVIHLKSAATQVRGLRDVMQREQPNAISKD